MNNSKLQKYYLLLIVFLLSTLLSACNSTDTKNDTSLPITINYKPDTNTWWLHFESDEPILCAINFSEAGAEKFDSLQAMVMSAPVDIHDIQLDVSLNKRYNVRITTFNKSNVVATSAIFSFTAAPKAGENLIEESGEIKFTPFTEFLNNASIWQSAPIASSIDDVSATVDFSTTVDTLTSTAYGETLSYGESIRMSSGIPMLDHSVELLDLKAETVYNHNTIVIDREGVLYRTANQQFTTLVGAPGSTPATLENIALSSLGASIKLVSSNWSNSGNDGAFGANNAIDNNSSSEWSSNGDGDDAFIEIDLGEIKPITSIGFWTRKMTNSAQISSFEVFDENLLSLGVFTLPDAKRLYTFDIPDGNYRTLRFEVVSSNGGNTGARSIEIYTAP